MKHLSSLLSLALACTSFCAMAAGSPELAFRQVYDLNKEKVDAYSKQVAADWKKLPDIWQKSPVIYYVVPAMSDIMRLPDSYPSDGIPGGVVRLVASRGEFEPGSIVLAPRANVDSFTLKATDLVSKKGSRIPASAIDIKIVKNWYQGGSAWYGYFADGLGRLLVPELLLNDENFIKADPKTLDNYARCSNEDGTVSYQWISADHMVTNYHWANQAKAGLFRDADKLMPVVLNKNEFKQYMITVQVPETAKEGIYHAKLDMVADGKVIGTVPLSVRVLPFKLPLPKTNYSREKSFHLCLYGTATDEKAILKNLADHNAVTPMGFPRLDPFLPEKVDKDIALAKEVGLRTDILLFGINGCGLITNEKPNQDQQRKLDQLKDMIQKSAKQCQEKLGHTNFYSYGIDEGGPWAIRGERNAWKIVHDAGGKVGVTSYPHKELINALDYLIIPGAPAKHHFDQVNLFHEMNPDGMCGWYANPHSGPENPDYFRRVHGYQAYKSNYDVSSNYCWYRNNWNDMSQPEYGLRGIIMVYVGRGHVFDTLAWEGVREGLDDVKYASYLKDLALEACKSKDGDVLALGRRVLAFLTYTDEVSTGLDSFRLECINHILRLRAALKKGN